MTTNDPQMNMLDRLLSQARADVPPGDDLFARILADAYAAQPEQVATPVKVPGFWARFVQGLGGWPALGGLSAAAAAGVWLGVSPPVTLADWAGQALGLGETVTLDAAGDVFGLTEG